MVMLRPQIPAVFIALAASCANASPTIVDLSADLEYSPHHNGSPGSDSILSAISSSSAPIRTVTVLEYGRIVTSYVRDGVDAEEPYHTFSTTKSWISTIIGIMVDDGVLSLSETLGDVFIDARCPDGTVWDHVDDSEFVQDVTIEEMLTMTSGLISANDTQWFGDFQNLGGANLTDSLSYPDIGEKGQFSYLAASQIMSYVIKERTGLSPREFASERIFPPLGINDGMIGWDQNEDGMEHSYSGLQLNAAQMAKFGQLYLQGGLASSQTRVVSGDWVQEVNTPRVESFPPLAYSYLFQLFDGSSMRLPFLGQFYCAIGLGGQSICVHSELERVLVTQIEVTMDSFYDAIQDETMLIIGFTAFNGGTSFEGIENDPAEGGDENGTKEPPEEGDDGTSSASHRVLDATMLIATSGVCSALLLFPW